MTSFEQDTIREKELQAEELQRIQELTKLNEELQREVTERKRAETALEQRTHLLSTLLDVSNLVSSTLELKPLLEAILDRLKTIIDYKGAKIFIIKDGVMKVVAHRSTLSQEDVQKYTFDVQLAPFSHEIIFEKKGIVIPDIYDETDCANSVRQFLNRHLNDKSEYIRSWMGLPLVIKDRTIGVLTIDHSEPNYYIPQQVELGMAFAYQVATEIENARLYSETIQWADELKTMFAVQQAITSRLDKDSILKLIADEARRLTNSERTAVFLVEGSELVLSVMSGKMIDGMIGYRLAMDKTHAGRFLRAGEILMSNHVQEDPEMYAGILEKVEVKSFVSVPMIAGSKPIGTIAVVDKLSGSFNDNDIRILKMLCSTAVIALENSRMYQEEHRRHMEDERRRLVAEGLRDVLASLNSNRPLSDILDFIIQQAVRIMGTDSGALYRIQKDKGILTIEAAMGIPESHIEDMHIPVGMGFVGHAVHKRKPVVVEDIEDKIPKEFMEDPKRRQHMDWLLSQYTGMLAVPLVCKDEVYGGIVLYFRECCSFSKQEVDLAVTFADQAALAIDNARLRAQAEEMAVAAERSRLARDLHDAVTQTLFSASLIAEVLPKIWERNEKEGRKRLDELRQLTKGALAEMRTLLLELRPATLVESGLKELLNQLTLAVTGRTKIPITLNIEGQPILSPDIKIAFYRIVQEALNNIAKHSGASHVMIDLVCTYGSKGETEAVELNIRDNGRGFDTACVKPQSLGLGIMKERAGAIGAEFKIESRLGEGTLVSVKWNITWEGEMG